MASVSAILRSVGMCYAAPDEQAMMRGSRVHAACHYDDEGDLAPGSVLDSDLGYIEAWRAVRSLYQIRWKAREVPIMDAERGIAGTPDGIGTAIIGGSRIPIIGDIKTGAMAYWTRYQMALYQMMMPEPFAWTRIAFELHTDGTWSIGGPWFPSSFREDRAVCEAAIQIYRAKERNKAL